MLPESTVPTTTAPNALLGRLRGYASRVPITAWAIFGLFMIAAMLMAFHSTIAKPDSSVRLKVQHSFRSAELTVSIDGRQVYTAKLVGYTKKKFGLIPDSVQGSMSETVPVTSGKHQLRVRVAGDDGSVEEDTVAGEFTSGNQKILSITARRGDVSLAWQGSAVSAPETTSNQSWFVQYANTLLLTAAGSIVSALTGYAIRELPNFVRTRQANVPKA